MIIIDVVQGLRSTLNLVFSLSLGQRRDSRDPGSIFSRQVSDHDHRITMGGTAL